jgi:hypothetical protein
VENGSAMRCMVVGTREGYAITSGSTGRCGHSRKYSPTGSRSLLHPCQGKMPRIPINIRFSRYLSTESRQ